MPASQPPPAQICEGAEYAAIVLNALNGEYTSFSFDLVAPNNGCFVSSTAGLRPRDRLLFAILDIVQPHADDAIAISLYKSGVDQHEIIWKPCPPSI